MSFEAKVHAHTHDGQTAMAKAHWPLASGAKEDKTIFNANSPLRTGN